MNEAETRAELIDPMLKASGWGVVEGSKVQREYPITAGKIQTGGARGKSLTADYVLVYHGRKLAVIEAKSNELPVGEGVAQAKNYAEKLQLATTYSSNGLELYQICMKTGAEGLIETFPSPEELWHKTFAVPSPWEESFNRVPFEDIGGTKAVRYYQELAINKALAAIAQQRQRILLTLATGTGKTFIAFQIVWKLFQSRWNLNRDGKRRPRVLFLADRNILSDQAFNQVIEDEVEEGHVYKEEEFNSIIEIKAREARRVQILLAEINQSEKAIIFCANQPHAAVIRDLINKYKSSSEANYCVRFTANDGKLGEQYLREFQDHEKSIPTILTTSQKLSTGVDALNIRNIVLLRPIKTIIEFKQIIVRGIRLFDGKEYFTIYDFVGACHHFSDVEWDGEPIDQTTITDGGVETDQKIVRASVAEKRFYDLHH